MSRVITPSTSSNLSKGFTSSSNRRYKAFSCLAPLYFNGLTGCTPSFTYRALSRFWCGYTITPRPLTAQTITVVVLLAQGNTKQSGELWGHVICSRSWFSLHGPVCLLVSWPIPRSKARLESKPGATASSIPFTKPRGLAVCGRKTNFAINMVCL